jgi:hypothetical protein
VEQLLFLLFVLFSVVSALLERRKRKRQREEQRQDSGPGKAEREEEEETWPFPMGGDPFEPVRPRRPSRPAEEELEEERSPPPEAAEVAGEREEPEPPSRRNIFQRLEDFAREEEGRARAEDERVRADQERVRQLEQRASGRQPAERVRERATPRLEPVKTVQVSKRKRRGKWSLTRKTARDAIVYAEIFGKPKADRTDELYG